MFREEKEEVKGDILKKREKNVKRKKNESINKGRKETQGWNRKNTEGGEEGKTREWINEKYDKGGDYCNGLA